MKITNTQSGPRGVNAVTGPVLIEPNQTWEGEVYARERHHLEASGWFDIKGDYTPDPNGAATAAPAADDTKLEAANRRIAELETEVKAKDSEIADLKKQVPETDIDKMTVAELRAHLAYRDIKFDSTKDKKDDLVTLAKAAA